MYETTVAALEKVFGPTDDGIFHATTPLGFGGGADVKAYRMPAGGVAYATAGLIESEDQPPNAMGRYELAVCRPQGDQTWPVSMVSCIAGYAMRTPLEPWDTMPVPADLPEGATLTDLLFVPYAVFEVDGRPCGVILCLGLTEAELRYCQTVDCKPVIERLTAAGEYPFTNPTRESVVLADGRLA